MDPKFLVLIDESRLYHTPPKLFKQSSLKDKYVPWHTGVDVASCNWLDAYTSEESSGLETQVCESSENRKATKEDIISLGIDEK